MKVIFLNDVPGVGKRYDIKTVSDGYALNFLFPKNLALMANPQSLAKVEKMKKEWSEKQKVSEEKIKASLVKLESFVLKTKEKANEAGHLFAGIDEKRIAELLYKEGVELPVDSIKIDHPIKALGEFEINIETGDKKGKLKLAISAK